MYKMTLDELLTKLKENGIDTSKLKITEEKPKEK